EFRAVEKVRNHFGATGYRELREDPPQVGRDRPHADLEAVRDRLIRASSGDHERDLLLAGTEFDQQRRRVLDHHTVDATDDGVEQDAVFAADGSLATAHLRGKVLEGTHE